MAISNLASVQPPILPQQLDGSSQSRHQRGGELSVGGAYSATSPSTGAPASMAISTVSSALYALPGATDNPPTMNILV